jgi:hypothetical protein
VATEIAGLQKHQPTLTSTVPRTVSLYPTQQFCQVAAARPAPPGFCEALAVPSRGTRGPRRSGWASTRELGGGRGWQKGRRANGQYLPRLGQAVDRRTASQSLAPARGWALVLCPAIWGPGQYGVCILTHAHCCSAGGYDSGVNCGYGIQPQGPGNSVGRDLLGPRLCSARPGRGWSLTLPQRHSGVKDGVCCEASSAPPRPVCPAILCLPMNSCLYHRTASGSLFADIH